MKISTVTSLIVIALAALFSTGCMKNESAYTVPSKSSFLGIVEHNEATFEPVGANTIAVKSDELGPRNNFSGDNVKILWGLITLKDY